MKQKYSSIKFSTIPAPVIKIGLGTPITSKEDLRYFNALIDTGYDGTVLISYEIFTELQLMAFKVPADLTPTAEFITGDKVTIKSAEGTLYFTDLELILNIDAIGEIHEILIGRQVLEEVFLALEGPEKDVVIAMTKQELKIQL